MTPPLTSAPPSNLRELYVAHAADLHRYAARRVGDDLAEDVLAETFRRAIESFDRFDADVGSARGWLFISSHATSTRRSTSSSGNRSIASPVSPVDRVTRVTGGALPTTTVRVPITAADRDE